MQGAFGLSTYLPHREDLLYVVQVDAVTVLVLPFPEPEAGRKQTKA